MSHLVRSDRKYKSSVVWFGVAVALETNIFLQPAQVEHLIEAGVVVGNDINDHVAVVLVSVHVVIDHHCSSVVLHLHFFARLFFYQVDESLKKKNPFRETL